MSEQGIPVKAPLDIHSNAGTRTPIDPRTPPQDMMSRMMNAHFTNDRAPIRGVRLDIFG